MNMFLEIPDYEGKYSIDVTHKPYRVWSHKRVGCSGKFLEIVVMNGARHVNIVNKNKKPEYKALAELVYRAFNPSVNLKFKILYHRDGDAKNDNIENLAIKDRYLRDCGGNIILRFE